MLPELGFGDSMFKVMGSAENSSVIFKPHEWRGTRGGSWPEHKQNMNVTEMANEINGYKPGTVSPIYVTSDGGANLDIIDQLVAVLQDHVEVVGLEIGDYAVQAAKSV